MDSKMNFNLADMACEMYKPKNNFCCVTTPLPEDTAVTMAYIPFQFDKTSYTPEKALQEGTLFTTLNKPFMGRSICNE